MKKVIDEEKLYDNIIENGFGRKNHPVFQELLVVAKKMRQTKKYGEKNLVHHLAEFCIERNPHFNFALSETSLISVSRAAMRNPAFRKPSFPIYISSDEMDKVKSVKSLKMQLLLLSALAYAKSSGNAQLFSDTTKDIREIIRISGERYTVPKFIEELSPVACKAEVFCHVNGKHRFYALSDIPSGDVLLTISNLEELDSLSELYRKINGGFPSWCSLCGDMFLRESYMHSKKLCENCMAKS